MRISISNVGVALAAMLVCSSALAQEAGTGAAAAPAALEAPPKVLAPPPGPTDEFGRGVPRAAMAGFLDSVAADEFERATEYLDLRKLPRGVEPGGGPELARQLAIVMDRAVWVDLDALSDEPEGRQADDLPANRDFVARLDLPPSHADVLLQRVPRGDGVSIWKISSATVRRIPDLHAHYGYGPFGEALAELFPYVRILGLPLWEWIGLLLIGGGVSAMVIGFAKAADPVIRRIWPDTAETFLGLAGNPLRLFLIVLGMRQASALLGPSVGLQRVLAANTLLLVALAWLAIRVSDVLIERAAERNRVRRPALAGLLGRSARNASRILIGVIASIAWLDSMGVEVTTLLAGLGIGGVALALAAQGMIQDIIAALTVVSTQTLRVGEFCRVGTTLGTVEEIGLRMTRIRTLDDSLVSVPNAELARLSVDNLGRRRKIWFHPRLRLRYDTTPEQIRYVLLEVRRLLYAHPCVLNESARIRFVGFGESSLDFDVYVYVDTTDYATSTLR